MAVSPTGHWASRWEARETVWWGLTSRSRLDPPLRPPLPSWGAGLTWTSSPAPQPGAPAQSNFIPGVCSGRNRGSCLLLILSLREALDGRAGCKVITSVLCVPQPHGSPPPPPANTFIKGLKHRKSQSKTHPRIAHSNRGPQNLGTDWQGWSICPPAWEVKRGQHSPSQSGWGMIPLCPRGEMVGSFACPAPRPQPHP